MKGHNDIFLYSIVFNHICFRAQLFFPEVGLLCQLCCACDFIKGSLLSPSTVPYNHMRRHHKSRFAVRSQSVLAQTFRVDAYYRKISCCSNLITLLLRKLLVLRSYYINSIFLNQYVKPFTLLSQSLFPASRPIPSCPKWTTLSRIVFSKACPLESPRDAQAPFLRGSCLTCLRCGPDLHIFKRLPK